MSANNRVATDTSGLGHSLFFEHRAVRLAELLEDLISKADKQPIKVRDMQAVQKDILDIQARASLPSMLECVKQASLTLSDEQNNLL